jgi:hypothetical protein
MRQGIYSLDFIFFIESIESIESTDLIKITTHDQKNINWTKFNSLRTPLR